MFILGLDPGLNHTGWGLVSCTRSQTHYHAHGVIHPPPQQPVEQRLSVLYKGLCAVMDQYQPQAVAIEETFVNKNAASSLKLGLARGVVLLVPGLYQVPVAEYGANTVKKTVVGQGHATKDQVALMVRMLLNQVTLDAGDGADALAIAICHAHHLALHLSKSSYQG